MEPTRVKAFRHLERIVTYNLLGLGKGSGYLAGIQFQHCNCMQSQCHHLRNAPQVDSATPFRARGERGERDSVDSSSWMAQPCATLRGGGRGGGCSTFIYRYITEEDHRVWRGEGGALRSNAPKPFFWSFIWYSSGPHIRSCLSFCAHGLKACHPLTHSIHYIPIPWFVGNRFRSFTPFGFTVQACQSLKNRGLPWQLLRSYRLHYPAIHLCPRRTESLHTVWKLNTAVQELPARGISGSYKRWSDQICLI